MNPFKGPVTKDIDPNKMSFNEMLVYRGAEYKSFSRLGQNVRLARPMLVATGAACVGTYLLGYFAAQTHVFGADSKGGDLIKVYSKNTMDDQIYSRGFQTMMYLAEPTNAPPTNFEAQKRNLAELGVVYKEELRTPLVKKPPHPKYL